MPGIRSRRVGAAVLALSLAIVPAGTALGTQPQPLVMTTTGAVVGDTQLGTFAASGAVSDTGTYAFDLASHKAFAFAGFGAPTFGIVRSLEFFAGQDGSFTLQNTVKFSLTDTPDVYAVIGTWAVVAGTGDYADLRGQGTITGLIDNSGDPETFAFVFTGTADYH